MEWDIFSEFLGTMVLIFLGNGVVASVSFKRMFANQSGKWIVIAMAWGLAVMCGVFVSTSMGGSAHLNPAVSIMVLISSKGVDFTFVRFVLYIIAQFAGAMIAQVILNFLNWKHIKETELSTVRGAHCTAPAYENFGTDKAIIHNLGYEYFGTLVLCGVIVAFGGRYNTSLGVLPVTLLVISIGLSLGSSTGYAINPARDLGPRIVYFIMTKTLIKTNQSGVSANWSYSWVPVVAPLAAGMTVGLLQLAFEHKI